MIGYYVTKWTEAFPTEKHKAETIAKIVVDEIIERIGIPGTINTDQGRDFEERVFKNMCTLMEISKTITTP